MLSEAKCLAGKRLMSSMQMGRQSVQCSDMDQLNTRTPTGWCHLFTCT